MMNDVPKGVSSFVSRLLSLDRDFEEGKSVFVDVDHKGTSYDMCQKNISIAFGVDDPSSIQMEGYRDPYWQYEFVKTDFSFISPSIKYIEQPDIQLSSSKFGVKGPNSKLHDCKGQMDWAFKSSRHAVCGLIPYEFHRNESNRHFIDRRLDYNDGTTLIRVFLDGDIFEDGVERVFCLWCLSTDSDPEPLVDRFESFDVKQAQKIYNDFWSSHAASPMSEKFGSIQRRAHLISEPSITKYKRRSLKSISRQPGVSDQGEARITLGGRSGQIRVSADSNVGFAKYKLWKDQLGKLLNKNTKQMKHLWDYYRRKRLMVNNPRLLDFFENSLESSNVDVEVDDQVKDWMKNSIVTSKIQKADFEKWIKESDDEWKEIYKENGVRNTCEHLYNDYLRQIDNRIPWNLYDFQKDDLARMLCKKNALYVSFLGSGKSRQYLSYIYMRDSKRNTIVLESRLIRELLKEVEKIGFPRDWIHIIESPEDAKRKNLGRVNLISYSRIWRPVNDKKRKSVSHQTVVQYYTQDHQQKQRILEGHLDAAEVMDRTDVVNIKSIDHVRDVEERGPQKTIGHLLRENYMNTVICDEAHRLKGGLNTLQAKTAQLLRAKHTLLMTGTAFKNYPRDIYALLVQAFGDHTVSNRWGYHHDILSDDEPVFNSQKKIFTSKFVKRGFDNEADKVDPDIQGKEIPKVPDESMDEWRDMLSPKVLRRNRYEPEVIKDIPQPEADKQSVEFEITKKHAKFYQWWFEDFAKWFEQQNQKDGNVGGAAILVQLNKLRFVSTFPQSEKLKGDNVPDSAPLWDGSLTSKQKGIRDRILNEAENGNKTILFSEHPDCLEHMGRCLEDKGLEPLLFTGKQRKKPRLDNLDRFRDSKDRYEVLLMSRQCGQAGYNISIADLVWSIDYPWVPSAMTQAEGRMLRPQWMEGRPEGAVPRIRRAYIAGTIDEYMKQKVGMKMSGIDEAMDHGEANINPSDYISLQEFAENMIYDKGLMK